jgi:hypothetical protein
MLPGGLLMKKRHITIPSIYKRRRKNFDRRTIPKKRRRPVRLMLMPELSPLQPEDLPPTLKFHRTSPKTEWFVPPVRVPLYWFDIVMLRRRLIVPVSERTFVCDGHRFHVIAQDFKVIGNVPGYTRWLCFREDKALPNLGAP